MGYLLDTNICIYLIKERPPLVLKNLTSKQPTHVGISSVTLAELQFGVEKSQFVDKNRTALTLLTSSLQVLSFDSNAAEHYGDIRAHLEKKGQIIGPMDLLIAGHARSLHWVLVTNNIKEFKRVPHLDVENWAK